MTKKVRMAMIGCGGMARHHLRNILLQSDTTEIVALCEPSPEALAATAEIFTLNDLPVPPNELELDKLLATYDLDAAFIITPHAYHHDQAKACLKPGWTCCSKSRW